MTLFCKKYYVPDPKVSLFSIIKLEVKNNIFLAKLSKFNILQNASTAKVYTLQEDLLQFINSSPYINGGNSVRLQAVERPTPFCYFEWES
jgi:hypothetical protein